MSYPYQPTRKEAKAAARLRAKGWMVSEPPCPECRGLGYTTEQPGWTPQSVIDGSTAESTVLTITTKPCSLGCPTSFFYGVSGNGTFTITAANTTYTVQ